jgi:hypothetical protein
MRTSDHLPPPAPRLPGVPAERCFSGEVSADFHVHRPEYTFFMEQQEN